MVFNCQAKKSTGYNIHELGVVYVQLCQLFYVFFHNLSFIGKVKWTCKLMVMSIRIFQLCYKLCPSSVTLHLSQFTVNRVLLNHNSTFGPHVAHLTHNTITWTISQIIITVATAASASNALLMNMDRVFRALPKTFCYRWLLQALECFWKWMSPQSLLRWWNCWWLSLQLTVCLPNLCAHIDILMIKDIIGTVESINFHYPSCQLYMFLLVVKLEPATLWLQ